MILRAPQAIERKGYSTRRYRRLRLISGLKGARYIGSAVAVQIRQGEGAAGTRCARQRPKRQGPGKTRAAALDLRTAEGEIFEDQPGGAADLFKSREVAIVKNAPPGAATKHVPIARLEAGDVFGETALIDGRNRSASAIAIGKVVELVIESSYSERELDGAGRLVADALHIMLAYIRAVPPRKMWIDGKMPVLPGGVSREKVLQVLAGSPEHIAKIRN